jgi:hypothetical protein
MWTVHARHRLWIAGVCLGVAVCVSVPAKAQTSGPDRWEIEFYGGGVVSTNPTTGTVSLPGPGEVFTTAAVFSPPVQVVSSSRRISSWYFGDGPILFDQAASALATTAGAMTRPFSARLVALDPVLSAPLGAWGRGGSVGVRVSRRLTTRLGAELSVDYSLAPLQIRQSSSDAIEASRTSFISAFNGLITSHPMRSLRDITSTATVDRGSGHQLFTSGAIIVKLRTTGAIIPYAAFGAGVISMTGGTPGATLTGNYRFANPTGSLIDETDRVSVTDARNRHAVAGLLGGGVKYYVSQRWGVRLDARVLLSNNAARTVVDAAPSVALGLQPAGRGILNVNPTIQFSNSSDPITALGVTAVHTSTLSGPAIDGRRTYTGSGVSTHTHVTAGILWRF